MYFKSNNSSNLFDVIVLTETWLNKDVTDLSHIPGYVGYHCCRPSKTGGGVSVFVRDNLLSESLNICLNNNSIECIGIRFKYSAKSEWTNVLGLYRPPSGNLNEFNLLLEGVICRSEFNSFNSVIAGDFNICLLKEYISKQSSDLINLMHSLFFTC